MKKVLICGTKENSLSNTLKRVFIKNNYKVYLFSRNPPSRKEGFLKLDLTDPHTFGKVLDLRDIDTVVFSQDTGSAFGNIENLDCKNIRDFYDTKILGSILFTKYILEKLVKKKDGHVKLIWTCGSDGLKERDYLLYHPANSALKSFVEELNAHYHDCVKAYYLTTPFMGRTTVGMLFNEYKNGKEEGNNPNSILPYMQDIIDDKVQPGVVGIESGYIK